MFYRHANIQRTYKQVSHKQGNKRVLSSDYWVYINWGTYIRGAYIRVGLYSGGGGGLYTGGLIHGRSFVLVINKSDKNKSVINREINVY
jgi:hypothetical protein